MAAEDKDLNRDPITDEPGSHPAGTGVSATGGAVAGAAAGAISIPVGMGVHGMRAPHRVRAMAEPIPRSEAYLPPPGAEGTLEVKNNLRVHPSITEARDQ